MHILKYPRTLMSLVCTVGFTVLWAFYYPHNVTWKDIFWRGFFWHTRQRKDSSNIHMLL